MYIIFNNSHATKSISVWTCGKCLLTTTSDYSLFTYLVTAVSLQQFRSRERDVFPNVVCDYQAPDTCNPNNQPVPCCQRPEVLGGTPTLGTTMDTPTTLSTVGTASGAMVVSSLLLMAAMSFATLLL